MGRSTVQLQAVLEMARRALREDLVARGIVLASPGRCARLPVPASGGIAHEVFMVLLLAAQNRLLHAEELFPGTLTQTSVYPREVVKPRCTTTRLSRRHPRP